MARGCTNENNYNTSQIGVLRLLFSRHGLVQEFVTDEGSQFMSKEWIEFCASRGIKHTTSPPYHQQSNGQAESMVKEFKTKITKLLADGHAIKEATRLFLVNYRSSPHPALGNQSPAEVFYGRRIRTMLEVMLPTMPTTTDESPLNNTLSKKNQHCQHRVFEEGEKSVVRGSRKEVHADQIKKYYEKEPTSASQVEAEQEEDEHSGEDKDESQDEVWAWEEPLLEAEDVPMEKNTNKNEVDHLLPNVAADAFANVTQRRGDEVERRMNVTLNCRF
uniref:Integrase catalytic domain-containing protein n=1 Tax=Ditylenchus dipsaci TaxID=166011 RepID=A0A915DAB7_9BILA